MTYVRKFTQKRKSGKTRIYYAEVESIRTGKTVKQRYIRSLGRDPSSPTNFPIEPVHFSYLAIRLMQSALTPNDVFEIIENMGQPVKRKALEQIGIYYHFGKKTFFIYLFYKKKSKSRTQTNALNAKSSPKHKKHIKKR